MPHAAEIILFGLRICSCQDRPISQGAMTPTFAGLVSRTDRHKRRYINDKEKRLNFHNIEAKLTN